MVDDDLLGHPLTPDAASIARERLQLERQRLDLLERQLDLRLRSEVSKKRTSPDSGGVDSS